MFLHNKEGGPGGNVVSPCVQVRFLDKNNWVVASDILAMTGVPKTAVAREFKKVPTTLRGHAYVKGSPVYVPMMVFKFPECVGPVMHRIRDSGARSKYLDRAQKKFDAWEAEIKDRRAPTDGEAFRLPIGSAADVAAVAMADVDHSQYSERKGRLPATAVDTDTVDDREYFYSDGKSFAETFREAREAELQVRGGLPPSPRTPPALSQ